MNTTPIQLLKAKRSSALKDARRIEAQFARLNRIGEPDGTKSNLHTTIVAMYREHAEMLNEAIRSATLKRS